MQFFTVHNVINYNLLPGYSYQFTRSCWCLGLSTFLGAVAREICEGYFNTNLHFEHSLAPSCWYMLGFAFLQGMRIFEMFSYIIGYDSDGMWVCKTTTRTMSSLWNRFITILTILKTYVSMHWPHFSNQNISYCEIAVYFTLYNLIKLTDLRI